MAAEKVGGGVQPLADDEGWDLIGELGLVGAIAQLNDEGEDRPKHPFGFPIPEGVKK